MSASGRKTRERRGARQVQVVLRGQGLRLIEDEGDEALLFHYTEIVGEGFRTLEEGGEVVFEIAGGEDERKQATRVETAA